MGITCQEYMMTWNWRNQKKGSYSNICKEAADKSLIYIYFKHMQDRLYWTCVKKKKQKIAGDDAEPFGYIKISIITGDKWEE